MGHLGILVTILGILVFVLVILAILWMIRFAVSHTFGSRAR